MKKIGIILAATILLTGCTQGAAMPGSNDTDSPDQIQVDEGLLTVDITVPASFLSLGGVEFTQAMVDETVETEGYLSGKLNDDGSVVYTMSKLKHTELIEQTMASFDESIEASLADYPTVTAVTRNDDFTEIRIETTENDMMLGFLGLGLSFQAYFFHILNGSEFNLDVIIVDSQTGEELDRTKYPLEE
jgi:hypothetical protein